MPYQGKTRRLLIKTETTYGTAATLAPADVMLCKKIEPMPLKGDWRSRELLYPWGGASPEVLTGVHAGVDFDFEAAGAGAAGTAPAWSDAILMCGFSETVTAGSKVDYKPVADGYASATMRWRIGGPGAADPNLTQQIVGARGALSFSASANQFPVFSVSAVGKYADAAQSAPETITAANLTAFYANCDAVVLGARAFTGKMKVRMEEIATKNLLLESRNATLQAMVFTFGTVAGNIIEITGPAVQMKFTGFDGAGDDLAANFDLAFTPTGAAADDIMFSVK